MLKRRFGFISGVISLIVVGGAIAAAAVSAAGAPPPRPSVWAAARGVPGLAALNTGGDAFVTSVACPAAGACVVSGRAIALYKPEATFVASEKRGVWGTAEPIPGLQKLAPLGSNGGVLSCPAAGECTLAGTYNDAVGNDQAYLANETHGSWGNAIQVPGLASLSTVETAITALSCTAPGDCAAVGFYSSVDHDQAFVVSEVNGTWGSAAEAPGTTSLNVGGSAQLGTVACASPGNCAAGGFYTADGSQQALVIDETDGVWDTAQPVPGTVALNAGATATVNSVACPSAGDCAAGGYYTDGVHDQQAFVVDEANGVWGTAAEVPGLNSVAAVSCVSVGDCSGAGGVLVTGGDHADVVTETGGAWGPTAEVPGMAGLGDRDGSESRAIACTASGYCAVGGDYAYSDQTQPFVADEADGTWRDARWLPGAAMLNAGHAAVVSDVSCAAAGYCAAGGYYTDRAGHSQAFVATETPVLPTVTTAALSAKAAVYGHEQTERISAGVSAALGVPAGTVTVRSGQTAVCAIRLSAGAGSCLVPATKFGPGRHALTAAYAGGTGFAASTAAARTFPVTRAGSRTALTLSRSRVTFGREQAARLTVRVAPQYTGTPTGTVTVTAGRATICLIRLTRGTGSCTLSANKLLPGAYRLTAAFAGSPYFVRSASARPTLTVLR